METDNNRMLVSPPNINVEPVDGATETCLRLRIQPDLCGPPPLQREGEPIIVSVGVNVTDPMTSDLNVTIRRSNMLRGIVTGHMATWDGLVVQRGNWTALAAATQTHSVVGPA